MLVASKIAKGSFGLRRRLRHPPENVLSGKDCRIELVETPMRYDNGTIIDQKYRIIEQIGLGGMGSVYKAEHLQLERLVAIKVLHTKICDENTRSRFEREALIMSKLQH